MVSPRVLPDKLLQVFGAVTIPPRNLLRHDQILILELGRQLPHKLYPFDDRFEIFISTLLEVIEVDVRRVAWLRRTQRHASLSIPRVRLENHARQIVESLRKECGITREISLELREQRHAEQVRQRSRVSRTIEHRKHRAVRRIDP